VPARPFRKHAGYGRCVCQASWRVKQLHLSKIFYENFGCIRVESAETGCPATVVSGRHWFAAKKRLAAEYPIGGSPTRSSRRCCGWCSPARCRRRWCQQDDAPPAYRRRPRRGQESNAQKCKRKRERAR